MRDVVTIGTATRDVFLESPLFKVVRDPAHLKRIGFETGEAQCFALGGKIDIGEPVYTTGGGATNAAVTFSRQGFRTAAIVKIGDDEPGNRIIEELKREGVTPYAARDRKRGTAYSTILLEPSGERTVLVYRGASENMEKRDVPLREVAARWAYVVPGSMQLSTLKTIFRRLLAHKTRIAFAPSKHFLAMGSATLHPFFRVSSVVFMNREEGALVTGILYSKIRDIFSALDKAVPGIVVMTDSSRGALVSDGFHIYESGVFQETAVVDRTGAGDAFGSGFVAGLMRRREICAKGKCDADNLFYAIRLGAANATSVIEAVGAKRGILSAREFAHARFKKLPIALKNVVFH